MNIVSKEPILEGWSNDRKYRISNEKGERFLLRVSDMAKYDTKQSEFVITIPAGVGLDTLRIAIKEGSLILEDITANSVTIQSGGGDMEMYNVSLGTVDIYSDIGAVAMSECTFNSINIGIGEGDVSVASGDSLERCRMELKTGTGDISYNGSSLGTQFMQPGSGKRFLTIQAGAGNIDISDQ